MAKFYSAVPPRIKDVKKPLRRTLTALSDDFHVCFEFQVGNDYDILIAHPKGIYVVEVKNDGRQIEGGSTMPKWHVRDDRGAVFARDSFFNQAKLAASNLKDYFRRSSRNILLSPCSTPPCSEVLCTYHQTFWWDMAVFPYVCIPEWNPKNRISSEPLEFCRLIQGNLGRTDPPFIVTEIPKRTWDDKEKTAYLTLSNAEISRLIKALGCVPISQSQALGEEPVWFPKIDPQVTHASRGSELDDLYLRLQTDKVVAVVGEPKIGKSTLCQMLASDLNQSGIPVCDYDFRLADNSGLFATTQLLHDFLSKVGLPEHQTLQDDISALLGSLITQPGLVIIDNFETALDKDQIIADAAMSQFIEQLLNIREKLKSFVIITSITPFRTKTRIRPPQYSIPGVSRDFALEYLTNESHGWSAEEAERIYNIRLGHPHAMRLASSEIRGILAHGFSFDEAYTQLAPEIVKLTYGISYDKLTQPERLAVEALSLHPSGLPLDAVEFILRRLDFHGNVIQLLMQLYSKEAISSTGTRWFSVLPQNRQYIYERADKIDLLHKAAMAYYQHLLSDMDSVPYSDHDQVSALVFFHSLRAKEIKSAFDAFSSLRWKPETFGFPTALATMGVQLKEHYLFRELSARDRGHVFQYNGRLFRHLGEIEIANQLLDQALSMFQEANDPILSASVLCDLGLDVRKQGEYARELELYDNALTLLGEHTTPDALQTRSAILGRKGQALQRKGVEPSLVFSCLHEAVKLARQIDDRLLIVTRLGMLGTAYRELGTRDMQSAIRCFTEAVTISKNTEGHPDLEAVTAGLAKTYEKARDHRAALALYLEALELTKETDVFGMLDRLGTLGHVHKSLGRLDESESYYKRALELSRKVGNRKAEAENLDEFGSLCRVRAANTNDNTKRSDLLNVALECHRTAVHIQETLQGDPAGHANRYQELGRTLFALHSLTEARGCFVKAIFCAREARRAHLEAWQFLRLGDVLEALGKGEQSVLCYNHAIRLSPREMTYLKGTAKKALEALPPDSRKNVMASMQALDDAIQRIVME